MNSDKSILINRGAEKCRVILNHRYYWAAVIVLAAFICTVLLVVTLPQLAFILPPGQLFLNITDDLEEDNATLDQGPRTRDRLVKVKLRSRLRPENYFCNTTACKREAKKVNDAVNNTFDPCDDFYRFACANWMSRHVPGETEAKTSVDQLLIYNYAELVAEILNQGSDAVPDVKVFFNNCVNPEETLFGRIRGMLFFLVGFQDWPYLRTSSARISINDVSSKIGDLHRHLGIDSLFHFDIVEEFDGNGSFAAVINEPNLLIGKLQGPLKQYEFLSEAFRAFMASMDKFADTDVAQLELDLAHRKSNLARDCTLFPKHCGSTTLSSLPASKLFSWSVMAERAFGERILVHEGHTVKVPSPGYLVSFGDHATLPRRSDVLNYLVFRVAMTLSPFLKDQALRDKLASIAYADQPEFAIPLPAPHYCLRFLDRFEPYVPMLLAYTASIKLLGYETLQELLLKHVNASFYEFVRSDKRFFGAFKDTLLKKLARLSWEPLVPRRFFDKGFRNAYLDHLYQSNPSASLESFFYYWLKNAMARRHWLSSNRYRLFKTGWKNGFLRAFPTLESPYLQLEIPLPVFDFIMSSHVSVQLLHVPRVAWRVYRSLYRFIYHWAYTFYFHTTATDPVSILENIRGCLRADYSQLKSPFSNMTLKSERTSLDDLVDSLAVPAAYEAFLAEALRGGTAFRLADAPAYSHEQLFFLYYAFGLCENNNPAFLEKWMTQGTYSPGWYRVNGPLRHFPAFANAFGCAKDTFMNPSKTCSKNQ
ncbi:unnamed protein product [Ixodes hexagonus]